MTPNPAGNDLPYLPGYRFLALLATDWVTEVYRARELIADRDVVIEVVRANAHSPEVPTRFVDAVRIQASLRHSGIPHVYHAGCLPDGRPFVVMNLIRGPELNVLLDHHPGIPQCVGILRQASEALGYAHSRGVIHRNVETQNVMLGEPGDVFLTSWGLSYALGALTQEVLARNPDQFSSVMIGTPAFMPPEQARGEQADERSDVFGLGGILCHILTGAPPFLGERMFDRCQAAAAGDLSNAFARLDASGADPELVALCKRCLAPNRADRPANGTAVAELLQQFDS